MAWSIVGVGSVVEVTATTHTLTEPAGCAAGDLLVACISSRIASTASITLPTGGAWTLVNEQKTNNTTASTSGIASGLMAYAIRGASAPNLTFTHPTAPTVAIGRIVAYRGGATTTPLDVNTASTTATAVTAVSVTGLTTTTADDLIVAMVAGGQEAAWSSFNATTPSGASGATDTTTAPSATWRERADTNTTTGADTSLAVFDALKTATGATGNLTATASIGGGHAVIAGAFKAAVSVSVSVTGQAIATSVGTPSVFLPVNVSGQSIAVSVGSVTVEAVTAPYFGPRSYAAGGPLGIGYVYEDSSRSYSTHYGYQAETAEAVPSGDVTVDVTGQAIAVSVGSATVAAGTSVSAAVTGQSLVASVGDVSVATTGGVLVPVTGQSLSVSLGPQAEPRSFALGGPLGAGFVVETGIRQYMGSAGYVAETTSADVVDVIITEGVSVAVPVTGQSVAVAVGDVSVIAKINVSAAVTGQFIATSVGSVTVDARQAIAVPVTGQSVAVSMGSVTVSTAAMAGVGVWNGSAWVDKPVKVWNGSAWVQKPVKTWNGSAWV